MKHDKLGKTAISRKALSQPVRWLRSQNLLDGKILDYGSGRGFDADTIGATKFDPYWHPKKPIGKFDTIICIYVLNVVTVDVQEDIIKNINSLMKKNGVAYIAVRRDEDQFKNKKIQRMVYLDFRSIKRNSYYEIYEVKK